MSSGKEHQEASENWSWVIGLAAIAVSGDLFAGFAAGAGCLAGIYLTPDLDVGYWARIQSMKEIKKSFPVLGRVWHIIWLPYAIMLPHRSVWSHWPIIGTAVRLAYLSFILIALIFVAGSLTGWNPERVIFTISVFYRYSLTHWFVLGIVISDTVHWLMDNGV